MANQEKLKSLIEKINWLYKSFEENNFQNISSLEKALIKEKVLMFYDEIENIETKIQQERFHLEAEEKIASSKNVVSEKLNKVEERIIEDSVVEEKIIEEKEEIAIVREVIEEPTIEKATEPEKVEKVVEQVEEELKEKVVEPILKESNEKVQAKSDTDLKKEQFDKTVEFQRQVAMPKRDMREVIDLNKSFIFKAELFNQDNNIYNDFINQINATRTEDEAFSIIVDWTTKMNWETEENKAYDLILRAIEKRFLPLI